MPQRRGRPNGQPENHRPPAIAPMPDWPGQRGIRSRCRRLQTAAQIRHPQSPAAIGEAGAGYPVWDQSSWLHAMSEIPIQTALAHCAPCIQLEFMWVVTVWFRGVKLSLYVQAAANTYKSSNVSELLPLMQYRLITAGCVAGCLWPAPGRRVACASFPPERRQ